MIGSENADALLNSVKAGDVIAFETLTEMYSPLLSAEVTHFMDCGSYRLSENDLDDLRQDALLALYKAACSYRENDAVSFGLYAKICIHNCLITAASRLSRAYVASSAEEENELLDEIEDPEASPEFSVIAAERMEEIQAFIEDQLTDYERRVFSLRLAHLNYAEIALAVGRDVKSVANALVRVKDKFRSRHF